MPSDGKKGITVKIDEELHAEVRQYLDSHEMTMAEFVTLALQDELHPKITTKEEKYMENMKMLAVQIPDNLFQRIKDYLHRNNMTQKEFVIGLIQNELKREQTERENAAVSDFETVSEDIPEDTEEQTDADFSDEFDADNEETESVGEFEDYDENEESEDDLESEDEDESEDENMGFSMGM